MTGDALDDLAYRRLVDWLNAPPRAVVQPWDDQHPHWCQPPGDPSDAVTSESAARRMLAEWPLRQQVLAGLTAVEMVVPVWEYWARSPARPARTSAHPDILRAGVREVRSWLQEPDRFGFGTPDDGLPDPAGAVEMDLWVPEPPPTQDVADTLYQAYEVAYSESWVDPATPRLPMDDVEVGSGADALVADLVMPAIPGRYDARAAYRAAYGAWSLVDVLARALDHEPGLTTFPAVQAALDAFRDHMSLPPQTVYSRWWSRVVSRLPLADAATCEFEVLDLQTRVPVTS